MEHNPRFLAIVDSIRNRVIEITPAEVQDLLRTGGAQVVDVREDREWAAGHVAGAVHMGKGVIERDIEAAVPDPATPLVLYCGGGFRSALAADALQRMGYTNVRSMVGGWRGWAEIGGAVTTGESTPGTE